MPKEDVSWLFLILATLAMALTAAAQEEEFLAEEEIVPEESAGVTPDSPLYIFDKVVDEVQLRLASGEEKTKKALEIKEERLAEAAVMIGKNDSKGAVSALELAKKATQTAQDDIAPELEKETNEKVRKAAKLLSGLQEKLPDQGWEGVEKAIDGQLSEEEKVRVSLLVAKSRLSYCDTLAKQDFDLMKQDELCQIEKAPGWLKERVEGEFQTREESAKRQIVYAVSKCIIDPKKCDCSEIPVSKHSQDCEVKKALAIKCEYENDNNACAELGSQSVEGLLPEFIGENDKATVLEALRQKEQEMFDKIKPPECEAVDDMSECFKIMKELYGTPIQCEGLTDDECMEFIKRNPPTEKPNLPPECAEAGVQKPVDCAEHMFNKYGKPPQCEGLDTKECMKLMRQERPDAMNSAIPKECQDAGAKEPKQCFDIMTAKFGMPPECKDLSADSCFEEMMKRGPSPQDTGEMAGQEPPECQEKGLKGEECFKFMCGEKSPQECFEGRESRIPPNCIGLSPDDCRAKMQEMSGMPQECAENPDKCQDAFEKRGVPGGIPAECAGLDPKDCELIMMRKFGPPECKESTKEECDLIMKEKFGTEGSGFGGGHGEPGPGSEGEFKGGFRNECEGLSRQECDEKMFERFSPPECQDQSREECGKSMRERFDREKQQQDENRRECEGLSEDECRQKPGERFKEPGQRPDERIMLPECQGLRDEECRSKFFQDKGRGEGEHREFPPGDEKFKGERREGEPWQPGNFREPLGAPIVRGAPSGCEGLSPEECGAQEKFRQPPMPQAGQLPKEEQAGRIEPMPPEAFRRPPMEGFEGRQPETMQENIPKREETSQQDQQQGAGGLAEAVTGQIVKSFTWLQNQKIIKKD